MKKTTEKGILLTAYAVRYQDEPTNENWNKFWNHLRPLLTIHIDSVYRQLIKSIFFKGLTCDDVEQECAMFVLSLVKRFDREKGYAFSSFLLQSHIQNNLHKVLRNKYRLIRLPAHPKTDYDIQIDEIYEKRQIKDFYEQNLDDNKEIVEKAYAMLESKYGPRTVFVIQERCKGVTLVGIGIVLGISKERVRQIEKRALKFLRESKI